MRTLHQTIWKIVRMVLVICLVCTAVMSAIPQPVTAQSEGPAAPAEPNAIPSAAVDGDEMRVSAGADGMTGVIVLLKVSKSKSGPFTKEQDALLAAMAGQNIDMVYRYQNFPLLAMRADAAALLALRSSKLVSGVQIDAVNKPSDFEYPDPEDVDAFATAEKLSRGGASAAGDVAASGYTGQGVTVAILDTGVQSAHSYLTGRVLEEDAACFSGAGGMYAADGVVSTCPNGADIYEQTGAGAGEACGWTGCAQGTMVAGITSGAYMDGEDGAISGVAPESNILSVNVFSQKDERPIAYDSDVLKGMDYVYGKRNAHNIASINLGMGSGVYPKACDKSLPATKDAIDRLRSANIATIVSSGSHGYTYALESPACISSAISVGSVNFNNKVQAYSDSASFLNFLAWGHLVYTSTPDDRYGYADGTSIAAAEVTGAWAAIREALPKYNVAQTLALLTSTGVPVKDARNEITKPRLNLLAALIKTIKPTFAPALVAPGDGADWLDSTIELKWLPVPIADRYQVTIKQGTKTVFTGFYNESDRSTWAIDEDVPTCWAHVPAILKPGIYSWTVQAYSKAGAGPMSAVSTFNIPSGLPGAVTLTAPVAPLGIIPTFRWTEDAAPYAPLYRLDITRAGKRIFSKTFEQIRICTGHVCGLPAPIKLPDGDYSWSVTPISPAGMGTTASASFTMNQALGYSNHFTENMDGMTRVYPATGWSWHVNSEDIDWLTFTMWNTANLNRHATVKIDAIYGNIDYTAVIFRHTTRNLAYGMIINGVANPTGTLMQWQSGYLFLFNGGQYAIYKRINNKEYTLQSWTSAEINPDEFNTFRVVSFNGIMTLLINGVKTWEAMDYTPVAPLKPGAAGLMTVIGMATGDDEEDDTFHVDSVQTLIPTAPVTAGGISAQQLARNQAANRTMQGSPAGPDVSMEEYNRMEAQP